MADEPANPTAEVKAAAEPRTLTTDELEEAALDAAVMRWELPDPLDDRRERAAQALTHRDAVEVIQVLEQNTRAIPDALSANAGAATRIGKEIAIPLWLIFGLLLAEIISRSGLF